MLPPLQTILDDLDEATTEIGLPDEIRVLCMYAAEWLRIERIELNGHGRGRDRCE